MHGFYVMFREGGAAMFVLVGAGLFTLATAFWFAVRPTAEQVGFLKWMSRALVFITLTSVIYDAALVFHAVAGPEVEDEMRTRVLLQGLAESCAPGILGGSFLALIAILAAVGQRRLDARKA
jgi:hypothetical protein